MRRLVFLLLVACGPRASVVLTVEDPDGAALHADRLLIGSDLAEAEERPLGSLRFPVTVALTADGEQSGTVHLEARNGERPLARGSTELFFDAASFGSATVVLEHACARAEDCDDGTYCNGAELCTEEGVCTAGEPPCPDVTTGCATVTCVERERACRVVDDC